MKNITVSILVLATLFIVSCGEDKEVACPKAVKADLSTQSLTITAIDDHHYGLKAVVANNSNDDCADSRACEISLKVYYSEEGNVDETSELLYDLQVQLGVVKPKNTREVLDVINFYESGYYLVKWELDPDNSVDELNEDNNITKKVIFKQ